MNESAVVAAVSAAAAAVDLEFVLFRFENTEARAGVFRRGGVVAPHGGALANLVHCSPGTAVVEIVPAQTVRLFYAGLSYARSLRYYAPRRAIFFAATSSSTPRRSLTSCAAARGMRGDRGVVSHATA